MSAPLKVWLEAEGRLLRLRLSRPKANLIDAAMIEALDRALADHLDNPGLTAVLLDAEGPHFSYGASVEEHMPGRCEAMLTGIHGLMLRMLGVEVRVVYSGEAALEMLSGWRPQAVLLDIGMPGMSGHQVARRIRQLPGLEGVTLIAITGWGQAEDRQRSADSGFDHHLVKPVGVELLTDLLRAL